MIREITPWETDALAKLGFVKTGDWKGGHVFQRRMPEVSGTMTIRFALDDYDLFGKRDSRWSGDAKFFVENERLDWYLNHGRHDVYCGHGEDLCAFFVSAYDSLRHFTKQVEWMHPFNWKEYGIDISSKARAIPQECVKKQAKEQHKAMTRAEAEQVELLVEILKGGGQGIAAETVNPPGGRLPDWGGINRGKNEKETEKEKEKEGGKDDNSRLPGDREEHFGGKNGMR